MKVGKNRAEASLARVQQLNPMVEVTADSASSEEKDADFFKKFDVVIATTCSQAELVRINSICRAANILFYAGDVFGFFGFSFMDLVSHNFVEEVTTQVPSIIHSAECNMLTSDLRRSNLELRKGSLLQRSRRQ